MRVLITGAAGFVGRHFVEALYQDHHVTCIDVLPDPSLTSRVMWNRMDVREFFRDNGDYYDLVIHLAAVVGGRQQIERNPLSLAVDLAIDADMFAWAMRTRPGRVVYYSSSAAYPIHYQARASAHRPLRESMLIPGTSGKPDMTYGWAKLTGEVLAGYAIQAGLQVQVFRPFSGYGEDQALDYPFPSFIDRAAQRAEPFDIWGDGTQTRDWIHIDDIVGATLVAIDEDVKGPINLGWGRSTSFDELADLVCAQAGYQPRYHHIPTAPTGVHHRVSDNTKMLTFYTPKITLEEGIARALNRQVVV